MLPTANCSDTLRAVFLLLPRPQLSFKTTVMQDSGSVAYRYPHSRATVFFDRKGFGCHMHASWQCEGFVLFLVSSKPVREVLGATFKPIVHSWSHALILCGFPLASRTFQKYVCMYGLGHIEFKKDKADKAFGFGSSIIAADRVGS